MRTYVSSPVKIKSFCRKSELEMFLFIPGGHNCTPIWRLHTKLYKGAWNVSANYSQTMVHKDLRLGKIVYTLVFYNIHFLGFFHWTVSNLLFFCCVTAKAIYRRRLMGMCRWMGSPFHDWFDYNGVAFSIELRAWGRTFSYFRGKIGLHIYGYLWLANVQECLYCRWNVNCSSFNLKNGSIHFRIIFRIRLRYINRKWLRWDRQNYFCPKVTKMGSEIRHTIDSNVVFPAAVFWMWRNGPVAWHPKNGC